MPSDTLMLPTQSTKRRKPTPIDLAYALPGWLARLATDNEWKYAPHLELIEDKLLDILRGKPVRMLVSMPPRHGKSVLLSQFLPPWFLGRFPNKKVLLVSYQGDYAKSWGRKARNVMKNWGPAVFDVKVSEDTSAANHWEIEGHEGVMDTVGAGGAITGKGADLFILDDLIKGREEALSSTVLESHWDWFGSDVYPRLEPSASMIIVATRWSEDDLIGKLISEMEEDPEVEPWDIISLPAFAEKDDILGRKEGEALWPERFNELDLKRRQKRMTVYWFCTPAETPILMADWTLKRIDEVKVGDEVIGYGVPDGYQRVRLMKTKVKNVFQKRDEVFQYNMGTRRVRSTKDHQWLKEFNGGAQYQKPSLGKDLCYVCSGEIEEKVDLQRIKDLNWFAGFFDGEGAKPRSILQVTQTVERNSDVCQKIEEVLDRLGWEYSKHPYEGKKENWSDGITYHVHSAFEACLELIRHTEIGKRERLIQRNYDNSAGLFIKSRDEIEHSFSLGEQDVYALETETGNYVAWGYASSNSAEYQQRPVPLKGTIINLDWFQRYTTEPANPEQIIISFDTAQKEKELSDYTAIGVFKVVENGYYLCHVVRDRFNHPRLLKVAKSMMDKWKPNVMLVEDKASGISLTQHLRLETRAPIIPIEPVADKVMRMETETPVIEAGSVYLPEHAPWLFDFEDELRSFPRSARKDQVDMLSQFLRYMRERGGTGIELY